MSEQSEREALQKVIDAIGDLEPEARTRVFRTVATFFNLSTNNEPQARITVSESLYPESRSIKLGNPVFSGHRNVSPKDFMVEKDPKTDVDRVVCLAYYLAHFKEIPHFKTADISKLNTEAAQRKLANAAYSLNHATQRGYLVPGPQNTKQLSAMGEAYVEALPNRATAKEVLVRFRPRKRTARKKTRAAND